MKKYILLILVFAFFGCNKNDKNTASGDAAFEKLSEEYLKGYLDWRPQSGVALGLHEYDGKIADYTKSSINAEIARLKDFDSKFSKIDYI